MCRNEPQVISTNKEIEVTDSVANSEMEYLNLEPIYKSDTCWTYNFTGLTLEVEPKSKIGYYNAIDFTVYNFILKGKDTVGMYVGWHPQSPNLYSFALRKGGSYIEHTNSYIEKAISNNNHFIEKEYTVINEEHIDDTIYIPTWDTMYRELYSLKTTNIWISKPLENKKGQTNATVIFKSDTNLIKYHFFGSTESMSESEKIIELAKQIK